MKTSSASPGRSASELISKRIAELGDWRGKTLAKVREIIRAADPEIVEEWKWRGTPVWSHDGLVCTGETYASVVKLTFGKGAALRDPAKLFNSGLDGKIRRAIDIREGEKIDAPALKALVREAVALNVSGKKPAAAKTKASSSSSPAKGSPRKARKPAVLPKSEGDAGVKAYIASLEPWQAAIAKRIDALATKHVRGLRKAIKWHCPFYGVEGQGWFLSFAAFQRHVKIGFFQGASLEPAPPLGKFKDVRSLDVRESDELDEKQLARWIQQAAALPGWDGGSKRSGGSAL